MPDGPPWIANLSQEAKGTSIMSTACRTCYHVTLDENRLWTVEMSFAPKPNVQPREHEIIILRPAFPDGYKRELNCREPGPEPKTVPGHKFDNEDIYVVLQAKTWTWEGGRPTGEAVDPDPAKRFATLFFETDYGTATVKLSVE